MSEYSRQYLSGVSWENLSSTATPLSASNLNQMDNAILRIDSEAFTAINTKANQATVNGCINSITFDSDTGVFTIGFVNGTSTTINTALEKVVTNFTYNSSTQSLVLTLADGSTQEISLEEFITEYEFEDSDTIGFSVEDGVVTAEIVDGSIGPDQMDPDYLADCEEQVDTAKDYARQSQSYALGNAVDDEGDPYRSGQSTDNAKYYCQQAQRAASEAGAAPFIGATSTTGGVKGLVPAPLIADREKFLKGDGGWAEVNLDPFTGATSSTAGAKGMVPQPSAGDEGKFLKGDGSWDEAGIPTFVGTQAEWNALSSFEKAKYEIVQITDDNTFSNTPQTDVANAQVGFTSSDTTDANADSWTQIIPIASGESLGGLFGKVSQMFKNVRYLYKVINSKTVIPVGSITAYISDTIPSGWLLCNGQAVARTTYANLFSLIGTTYGAGDGSTTFNVPDLRGEFLRGAGTNSRSGCGSGSTVGAHQDPTIISKVWETTDSHIIVGEALAENGTGGINADSIVSQSSAFKDIGSRQGARNSNFVTTRPTNTSVNYIIKAK